MASHETQVGWLDFGSGRSKLIGRPGREECSLHRGKWQEVWNGSQWRAVQLLTDEWGCWHILDVEGERVSVLVGVCARLVN